MTYRGRTMTALLFLLTVAPTLVSGQMAPGHLSHSTVLDADNKYHIAWDFDEESVMFEVSVQTLGYIGLGLSPNGGMAGSDIVIGWVDDSTGQGFLSDRHAVGRSEPVVDDRQDYTLLTGHQNDTHTVLRFTRKLDLCGPDDHYFQNETVRVIWAYGEADPTDGRSAKYHGVKRGNRNMFLLNFQRQVPALPDNVIIEEFLNPQVTIPNKTTMYWCQSFPIPRLDQKHHVIKVEPVIQPGHESEVHHIIVYGCFHPVSNESLGQGHECYRRNMPRDFWGCSSTVLAWGIGGGADHFPENVGLPFGFDGDPTMLMMETHYDNPQRKSGLVDSSGLRITLTPDLREYDAGILTAGADVSRTQVIPPYADSFRTSGHCFPQCLSQAMENQPQGISMFGVGLHTHLLGRAIRVRHFRRGIEQPRIAEDENYDFNYQYTRLFKNEIKILPGDDLIVECDYNSTERKTVTYGGLSTREEMCLAFLIYYPRIELGLCESSPSEQYLASQLGATLSPNGTITSPTKYKGKNLYEVLNNDVTWADKDTRDALQDMGSTTDVAGWVVECSQGKFKYPIHGSVVPLEEHRSTVSTRPTCGSVRTHLTELLLFLGLCLAMM